MDTITTKYKLKQVILNTQAYRVELETDNQQVKTQNCCSHSSKTTPSVGYPQNLGG